MFSFKTMFNRIVLKKIVFPIILLCVLFLSSSAEQHKTSNEYGNWLAFHQLKDSDFEKISESTEYNLSWSTSILDTAFSNLYQPFFIYSADSSFYIDLDSYSLVLEKDENGDYKSSGSGVDTKVQLVNKKTQHSSDLLFCGTHCYSETAIWFSDQVFQIASFRIDEKDEFIPTLLQVDLKNNVFKKFENKHHFKKRPPSYATAILLKTIDFKD